MYCKQRQESGGGWEGFVSTEATLMQLTVGHLMFSVSFWLLSSQQNACAVISLMFYSKISFGVQQAVSADSVGQAQLRCINFLIQEKSAFSGFATAPPRLYSCALGSFWEASFNLPEESLKRFISSANSQIPKVSTAPQTVWQHHV